MNDFTFATEFAGRLFTCYTTKNMFSPRGADPGSMAMLRHATACFAPGVKALDLGCGYGLVGIIAAASCGSLHVVMSDILPEAVSLARYNAGANNISPLPRFFVGDGFTGFDDNGFDLILSNPPYHTDFSVPKSFIEQGFCRLSIGGRMLMVTKRREWYKRKFISVFGGVTITEDDGYFIFEGRRVNKKINRL